MATYWTLEYNGSEQTLTAWGFSEEGLQGQFGSMVVDTLNVNVPESDITAEEIIPFEGQAIIRRGRSSTDGSANSFSGGTVEFQGKRLLHIVQGRPDFEGVTYQFGGPWYDIDACDYQQKYCQFVGDPAYLAVAWASDVFLFQKIDVTLQPVRLTTGQMIADILQYCLDQVPGGESAPFQIGTIEPALYLNTYQAQDLKCSEAIHHCMRSSPDCAVQFDYTTVPPTLNIRKRSSLTAASVTFADGTTHESITLTPRYDLQPRVVIVRFKSSNQVNDQGQIVTTTQKYGPHGANSGSDPDGGRRVIVQTVDLEGYRITTVQGKLDCVPFTNDRGWWQTHFTELKTMRTRRFRIGPLTYTDEDTGKSITLAATTIKDKDGNDIDLGAYPNQLRDGASIAPWMKLGDGTQIVGVKATITAELSCKQYDVEATGGAEDATNGRLLSKYPRKQIEAHVTLTNGVTGRYWSVASATAGETIPAGMAQGIYQALSLLQYQGTFSVVEGECATAIRPGDALVITNGRSEWSTMKALVQQVTKDYGQGRTTITIGPAAHLSAGDLTQLFLVNRFRRAWKNPLAQSTGLSSQGYNTAELGDKAPHQNSLPGLKEPSKTTVSAPHGTGTDRTILHQDAESQALTIKVLDSSGALVPEKPQIRLTLLDLAYAAPIDEVHVVEAIMRRAHYVDANDGLKRRCYITATCPEDDETDDGHSDEVEDIYIGGGGGGGGLMMCVITKLYGDDYFQVQHLVAGVAAGDPFLVAKSIPSRMSGIFGGDVFTYITGGFSTTDNVRTINDSMPLITEYMVDPFNAGDTVYISRADGTGVEDPDTEVDLKFIEINTQREWAEQITPAP